MSMKPSDLRPQDGLARFFSAVQLVIFAALFLSACYVVWHQQWSLLVRIFCIALAYFVIALFTYLVLRPLCMYIEAWIRRRKGR